MNDERTDHVAEALRDTARRMAMVGMDLIATAAVRLEAYRIEAGEGA